jgi:hypothetical protein
MRLGSAVPSLLSTAICATLLAAVPGAAPAEAAGTDCPAERIELPGPPGSTSVSVDAMSNRGWLAGSAVVDGEDRLLLWRNGRDPLDIGPATQTTSPGHRYYREAVDLNDRGVLALRQITSTWSARTKGWHQTGESVVLWHHGTTTTLTGTSLRPWATLAAINDHGLAVGYIAAPPAAHLSEVPVVWRHGKLERLPLPARAQGASWENGGGHANDVNDRGLVVGAIGRQGIAAWWRIGGRHGTLAKLDGRAARTADFVDDHDRIIGTRFRYTRWADPQARPHLMTPYFEFRALTDDGAYVAGREPGDPSGDEDRHVQLQVTTGATGAAVLPSPDDAPDSYAVPLIASGVTAYAPDGGITVAATMGGEVTTEGVDYTAVLWTCAQSYLP